MVAFNTLDRLDVGGKRVLVRVDLNLPVRDGAVTDRTRVERLAPTLEALAGRGAKVILLSHFGRPKAAPDTENSLRQVMPALADALPGRTVRFAEDCVGPKAEAAVAALGPGEVLLLENLRFHAGEEANDPGFAAALAALGDVYVNDAFSVSHRAHASVEALARLLPRAAGLLMREELSALASVLEHPARPVAALVGGSKVSTKLDLLGALAAKVDYLIIGGAMANTLLLADGIEIGTSLVERDMLDIARSFLQGAAGGTCRVILPIDAVVADQLTAGVETETVDIDAVPDDQMILDIGPSTVEVVVGALHQCKTLVWNGPAGAFETPPFDAGTTAIARAVAERVAAGALLAVAGGGDTVSALARAGVEDKLSYVSSAGGAFLEWLEGRDLPGVAALAP
jgi:phosphoglycerate kinase